MAISFVISLVIQQLLTFSGTTRASRLVIIHFIKSFQEIVIFVDTNALLKMKPFTIMLPVETLLNVTSLMSKDTNGTEISVIIHAIPHSLTYIGNTLASLPAVRRCTQSLLVIRTFVAISVMRVKHYILMVLAQLIVRFHINSDINMSEIFVIILVKLAGISTGMVLASLLVIIPCFISPETVSDIANFLAPLTNSSITIELVTHFAMIVSQSRTSRTTCSATGLVEVIT